MRVIIQRVSNASVKVDGIIKGSIEHGYLLFVGIAPGDDIFIDKFCKKIVNMRLFADENGKMNKSIIDVDGSILSISQFTLYGSVKKGNRPSFIAAEKPDKASEIYERFNKQLELLLEKSVQRGVFGADMKVELLNDGPVTIIMDSDYL